MLDIKMTRRIDTPIEKVWRFVVDDFANGHLWAYGTPTCRAGTEAETFDRVCETETGTLRDTITTVDETGHVLEFSVDGLPFFVRSAVSTWSLTAVSEDQTDITIGPRIETIPVIGRLMEIPMRRALTKLYPGLLDDLATYIETGRPSERKQRELAKHAGRAG